MSKPFWGNTYVDNTVSTFGVRPNQAIEAYWVSDPFSVQANHALIDGVHN
jgi:hypothetical protein